MITYNGKIIVIAGPTASGKSDIALQLAKDLNGYIINADSRQVYREMSIGTAKPIPHERISDTVFTIDGIKHFLFDFVDPKDSFTLFDYQQNVQIIKKDLEDKSLSELQQLASKYISSLNESDRQNRYRLIRVIERKGINSKKGTPLNHIYFVIDTPKDILSKRIEQRIESMFKNGLENEVLSLLNKGYTYEDRGMNSIGYIEFKEYFEKKISLDDVKKDIYKNTIAYVKRQKTWFKRNKQAIYTNDYKDIYGKASNFIFSE
ncbi:MAG: tRNA dimethylallyltransferase [candidate division WS6 bacterium GW2011_GWD1_35_594]|nr:MAG: tRNA dimethylallyltransferase [candidate division WS6 bacterium GW2011_GWD1_35_594]